MVTCAGFRPMLCMSDFEDPRFKILKALGKGRGDEEQLNKIVRLCLSYSPLETTAVPTFHRVTKPLRYLSVVRMTRDRVVSGNLEIINRNAIIILDCNFTGIGRTVTIEALHFLMTPRSRMKVGHLDVRARSSLCLNIDADTVHLRTTEGDAILGNSITGGIRVRGWRNALVMGCTAIYKPCPQPIAKFREPIAKLLSDIPRKLLQNEKHGFLM